MEIRDYLKDEMKRLNRINDLLEKKINQDKDFNNKKNAIKDNALTMCEIAKTLM